MQLNRSMTVDDVMALGTCYSRRKVMRLFAGRERMTIDDLKSLPVEALSYMDRCWLLLRKEFLPKKTLHLIACDFAESALKRERKAGREPDPRSWEAIRIKRLWVDGKATDDELEAALNAAWPVAWTAVGAAEAAAWAATGNAILAAAAVGNAARAMAQDTEETAWEEQYERILSAIESVDRDEAQELTGTEA